jgi:hypothetical protein
MACIPVPSLPFPVLPAPLSLSPPLPPTPPTVPGAILCCKLPPVPPPPIPIPIPPLILNPALLASLNAFIDQARAYINSLPLKCPVE